MNIDTNKVNAIIDTNTIIYGIIFGGKPRQILNLVLEKKLRAITSPTLLAEFEDVIFKKFPLLAENFEKINKQIRKNFKIVKPKVSVKIARDETDNRVLEAAVEGECSYIITGDKDLLNLKPYKKIKIVTAGEFLDLFKKD